MKYWKLTVLAMTAITASSPAQNAGNHNPAFSVPNTFIGGEPYIFIGENDSEVFKPRTPVELKLRNPPGKDEPYNGSTTLQWSSSSSGVLAFDEEDSMTGFKDEGRETGTAKTDGPWTWTNDNQANFHNDTIFLQGSASAQPVTVTLESFHSKDPNDKFTKDFTLLKMELFRDADFTKKFDDWPANGNKPRSPKYLLNKEADIFVRLPSLGGVNAKVRVKSESDTNGVEFDLSDTGTGYHSNLSNGLRLGTATVADQNGHPVIKVIDEEVLTFELLIDGNSVGEIADVMADRAEFASCGIDIFYGSSSGDRSVVRNEALNNSKFFDAGDGNYPDNVVDLGNAMKTFIQNAGANFSHSLGADILHISAHGGSDGNLYDHTSLFTNLIIDPADILSGSNWASDLEWVILAACSQLNEPGGGKASWEPTLSGSGSRLHGILGAYEPVSGDLQAVYSSFWANLRGDVGFVPPSYALAMSSTSPAQPYAIFMRMDNALDDFKDGENFITQDSDGGDLSYTYLNSSIPACGRVGSGKDEKIFKLLDGGNAMMLTEARSMKGRRVGSHLSTKKHLLDERSEKASRKQLHNATGYQRLTGDRLDINFKGRSSLSESDALGLAYDSLIEIIPDYLGRLKLREISPKITISFGRDGQKEEKVVGYIVQFSHEIEDGVLAWGDFVNVSIFGDSVENISMRLDEVAVLDHEDSSSSNAEESSMDKEVLEFEDALKRTLPQMKSTLGIKGKYEILEANLCYVDVQGSVFGNTKRKGDIRDSELAWHIVVNPSYQGKGSLRYSHHVWINAETGRFIGSKRY